MGVELLEDPEEGDVAVEMWRDGFRAVLPLHGNWMRMVEESLEDWIFGLAERGVIFDTFRISEYIGGEWRHFLLGNAKGDVTWLSR